MPMSDAKPQQEPSMEEILASIRRIIAEDERPAEAAPPPPPPPAPEARNDVLELTEALNDDGTTRRVTPPGAPEESRIEPEPPRAPDTDIAMLGDADLEPKLDSDRLMSASAAGAAAAAFARFGSGGRTRGAGDIALGDGDRTLEEIVRDVLRPLLQAWLDDNLPRMVERLVRDELSRVAGEARLR